MSFLDGFSKNLGIDLGTANTLAYIKGKGIVINEPSIVAIDKNNNKVIAIGSEASDMLERTPKNIMTIRPLKNGVIADFEITQMMLKYFIKKTLKGFHLFKPIIVIGIPTGVTSVEKRAVEEAAQSAGGKKAILIEEPMAAAIGSNLPIHKAEGNIIVDMGGGTTDTAVMSLGGIVESESIKIAGDNLDEDIREHLKKNYRVEIGLKSAEKIKKKIGNAIKGYDNNYEEEDKCKELEVVGRDLVTGLPKKLLLKDDEIREFIKDSLDSIVASIKRVLEKTPPELASDISENGIYIAGGGALLKGLDKLIERETGIVTKISEDPLNCVVKGTGIVCENLEKFRNLQ
ncbi:MAG: rod shape-determining protein [Bacillota bacterium]|nr:rod shape-determining protein [Bacillota bacterium]